MTTIDPCHADWQERAACAGTDEALWFSKNPARARKICGRCPVRPECLYDALQHETPGARRHGIRGGLTGPERNRLPVLDGPKADAIATLRELLPPPEDDDTPEERQDQPMSTTPTTPGTAPAAPPEATAKPLVAELLKWGDEHSDPGVQDQAARARAALAGLRQRHAADQELTAITTEAEQLEKRLAELRAREQELAPAKKPKSKRTPVDYPAAEVRAWAAANGYDCAPLGRVPKKIVDAWRAATGKETAGA